MKIILIVAVIAIGLFILGWMGLQFKPTPFPLYPGQTPVLKTVPLPRNLPTPVERFYRAVYGEEIPVIETVVIKRRCVHSCPLQVDF